MSAAPLTDEEIRLAFHVKAGQIVWQERSADFYRSHFARAYNPTGAANQWNKEQAGKPPVWRYDRQRDDFTCTAFLRVLTLRRACTVFGVDYETARASAADGHSQKRLEAAKTAVLRSVDVVNGVYVWRVRTEKTHPSASRQDLRDFNERYAGKPLRPRNGLYKVSYSKITEAQMKEFFSEGANHADD